LTGHRVWEPLGPGSGIAYVEAQRGLTDDQVTAVFFGEPLPEPVPNVDLLSLTPGHLGNLLGSSFSAHIVSATLRDLLVRTVPGQLQLVPARLPGRRTADYAILNVLARVACLDLKHSRFQRLPGHPDRLQNISRLALRPIPKGTPPIFHIAEIPAAILVRKDLQEQIMAAGNAVGKFVPTEDYRWGDLP
jgi:hypothetical protein